MALNAITAYTNNYTRDDGGSELTMPKTDYTIAMWVKRTAGAYSQRTTIFQMEAGAFSSDYTFGTTDTGLLSVIAAGSAVVSAGTVTAGVWKYVAVTHSSTTFEIWMGAEASAVVSQGSATNAKAPEGSAIQIFSDSWNGFFWGGSIAYPRMWNAALTGVELEAERTSTTIVKTANQWATWDFSAATATITDGTGGGRTISKFGTVTTDTDPTIGGGGRVAKNTRAWGLGTELGMGLWMPNQL